MLKIRMNELLYFCLLMLLSSSVMVQAKSNVDVALDKVNPDFVRKLDNEELLSLEGLHVYGSNNSNASVRVLLYLEERGLDYTFHDIDLVEAENLTPQYLQVNPKGLIPAIIHENNVITESSEILKYLSSAFFSEDFIPKNKVEADLMWHYVDKAASEHLPFVVHYLNVNNLTRPVRTKHEEFYKNILPSRYNNQIKYRGDVSSKDKEEVVAYVNKWLGELDSRLEKNKYLINDNYTIADMAWFSSVKLLTEYARMPLDDYPNVEAWLEKISSRPTYNENTKFPDYPPRCIIKFYFNIKRLFGDYYT